MRIVLLHGISDDDGAGQELLANFVEHLNELCRGAEVKIFGRPVRPCLGCFGCWVKTPGECVIDDEMKDVMRAQVGADLRIFFSRLHFGGYAPRLKTMIDRQIPLVLPFFTTINQETHHTSRYPASPPMMGVAVSDQEIPSGFDLYQLQVARNAINFHAPRHCAVAITTKIDKKNLRERIQQGLQNLECGGGV